MTHGRLPRSQRQRLVFLALGNALLLAAIFALLKPGASFAELLRRAGPDVAPTLIAGLGMTGIIFTGAIDLSVASIIALAATVFGILVQRGAAPWVCFAACFAAAAALSALNGWLVRLLRIPPLIVTLAGLPFYRGLALMLADALVPAFSGNISVQVAAYQTPGKVFAGAILLVVLVAALAWEHGARTPRQWLALGSSEEAVRLAGLNPARVLQSAFVGGGLFLGVAAVLFATRIQAIEPARMALGFELGVIGAVVLGGTNIFGGEGSYLGTMLGAFFLPFVGQALVFAGVSPYGQEVITGAVILAVIGLDCALHRRRKMLEELA